MNKLWQYMFRLLASVGLILSGYIPNYSQTSVNTLVHLDKPYYVTGEIVYYKAYFGTGFNRQAPMVEIAIFDNQGTLVDRSYLKKGIDSFIFGHYKIPFGAPTGLYILRGTCLVEQTKDRVVLFQVPVPIYNDSDSSQVLKEHGTKYITMPPAVSSNLQISLNLDQPDLQPRQQVSLEIEIKDLQGNPVESTLSIAITDLGLIGEDPQPFTNIIDTQTLIDHGTYLSEYIPVAGKLTNHQEGQLMTFFMSSSQKIYYTTSESGGEFQLLIPGFYGDHQIQYISEFSGDAGIELSAPETIQRPENIVFNESVVKYLEQSRNRKLIYQLFNKVEGSLAFDLPAEHGIAIPDRSFQASDYPFENLPSFCKELSIPLKYVKRDGNFVFKMFNPESRNFYFGNPLFIVDGQMTKNPQFLSNLDFQSIDKIYLYYDNQRLSDNFGFAGFSGVVVISSQLGNLNVPQAPTNQRFLVNGLQPPIKKASTGLPDLREPLLKPQLFWEPAAVTNKRGQTEVSYQQSDDLSVFRIEVVAQDHEGNRGIGRMTYQVK